MEEIRRLIHVICEICDDEAWLELTLDQAWIDDHLNRHKAEGKIGSVKVF